MAEPLIPQELFDESGELTRLLVLEAGVHHHQGGRIHVVGRGGDDKVGTVVVDKQLPREAVFADERVAERGPVHARDIAAGISAPEVRLKGEVLTQNLFERRDDVVDRSVDSGDGSFGEVAVDLGAGGGIDVVELHAPEDRLERMSKKKPRPTPVPAERIAGLIDAHTHLASAKARTQDEVDAMVERAVNAGVERICTVGDGLDEAELALQAAHMNDRVFAACAIHPTRADELDDAARERLTEMAADERCVAIGETGIDTYWIKHDPEETSPLDVQEEAFRWHIQLAVDSGKALMIHNREGDAEMMRVLADSPRPEHVMLHCFSSPLDVAREAIERGYILSFAGNVTFKRNDELREAARIAPAGQLLIETDAPYMTPEPFRGARNEPSLIGHTAKVVAEARGMEVADLASEVNATFGRVFGV